ncbi:hypothetical protein [Natranaerofaba carboxydovora]|uniref:hypothetical protein n=1 Tax=Natranaerofaba carboxydovora TaxID=2742683 RepID=UPI001F1307CD|nr:hypothetical protein [Natranaerofaba carboxydovora]UMZ73560.1 hypothetical protein ACONDI_01114 [Natranaerofaba carboxydovora]
MAKARKNEKTINNVTVIGSKDMDKFKKHLAKKIAQAAYNKVEEYKENKVSKMLQHENESRNEENI